MGVQNIGHTHNVGVYMFENITKHWKQSYDMFSKKEILLFIFSWIRTFNRSFIVFLKYFWWLIAVEIIFKTNLLSFHAYHTPVMILTTILSMFSIFFLILSVRSSLEVKNVTYFISKIKKLFSFSILYIALVSALTLFIIFNTGISPMNWALASHMRGANLILQGIMSVFFLMSGFFIVDNQLTITRTRIIKNTCKSIFMYLPVLLILSLLYLSFDFIASSLMWLIHPSLAIISVLFLNFFFACAIAVLYLKIKHRNHALFFGTSELGTGKPGK